MNDMVKFIVELIVNIITSGLTANFVIKKQAQKNTLSQSGDNIGNQTQFTIGNDASLVINQTPDGYMELMEKLTTQYVNKEDFKKFKDDLKNKLSMIKDENIVQPSANIWGKTLESLRWNLDDEEKYIRDMFENILVSDMDAEKKNKVRTAFIDIVNQLDNNDARFLKDIIAPNPYINLYSLRRYFRKRNTPKPSEYREITLLLDKNGEDEKLYDGDFVRSFDNLKRLGLVEEDKGYWTNRERVDRYITKDRWIAMDDDLEYTINIEHKGRVEITKLGQDFIDICLPR